MKLGLPQPGGGRKEYLDAEGKVERVVEWFGYKLHLLVDVRHELALAYWITEPAVGDNQMIAALLEQARANLPEGRIESLAYDKAADDEAVHRLLHKAGIKPLIENRALWKGEPERMLPGHTGRSNLRPPDLWDSVVEPSSGFRLRRRSSTRVAAWCRDR